MSFKDVAFMGIMRWAFYNKLKETYPNVSLTYGYITKNTRIENGLPKDHYIDARCISSNPKAVSNGGVYFQKKVRCHNRQIHKNTILKGGCRKRNQAPYEVMGFRLYDKVCWRGQNCFIFGRRSTGRMDLRLLDGTKVNASVPSLVEGFVQIIEWNQDKHQEKNKNDSISDDNYPQGKSENKEENVTNARTASIRGFIVQIANLNAEIAENSLSKELNSVVKTLQAICKLIDNGLTHPSLRRMETYYLPELITLLTYYKKEINKGISTKK